MKFSSKKPVLSLLAATLLVGSNALEMQPSFREGNFKNIAFTALIGGSSHHNWVLSIIDELGDRGHNVSYLTSTQETRFGQPFQNVRTVDIGPEVPYDKVKVMQDMCSGKPPIEIFSKSMPLMTAHYERDYFTYLSYFESNRIDLALCDHFVDACVDAANTLSIPFIVTSTLDYTSEAAAPYINNNMNTMSDYTTEFQSFSTRFKNKFIVPLDALYRFYPHIKDMMARKRAIGIEAKFETPESAWKDSIKLVNSLFGYTAARPLGPLSEHIGPIIPKKYKPLTGELEQYFSSHERVAYIAFGQQAVPSEQNIRLILTGLLESIEAGTLDGFLWATVNSGGSFPDSITTSSNTTYNVLDMFSHANPHARMIKWAPQIAILAHPSTAVFVSHGGLGSWYESMYAGTPMIMFPFFGDQPGNALIIERSALGGIIKSDGPVEDAVELFKKVVIDEDDEIKKNVKRIQALTQIHSEHSILRAADIVEEVAYTHKDNKLLHRQTASLNMPYIKSHNIDLYAALLSLLTGALALAVFIISKALGAKQIKMKTQ
ncbi:uncharacterized protein EV154DRAFT_467773 [Mucor mucedo]|uniref:uncharacterized protein n=1 Tax=Mucor mucedo TaxID=29922 RepID=UPI00221E78A7|nr:uncharacterized protein EV154DRAFT_467773 [Mucor mucedo]KAI7889146.1 hypothetical protein EV154DRAFT_467773 [Mucor mucedo]